MLNFLIVKESQTKTMDEPKQLSSMEVHNLVKEKLRLQGINIKQNTSNAKKVEYFFIPILNYFVHC